MQPHDNLAHSLPHKALLTLLSLSISLVFSLAIGYNLHMIFSGEPSKASISPTEIYSSFCTSADVRHITLLIFALFLLGIAYTFAVSYLGNFKNRLRKITPQISTPYPSGRGEYGTAAWLDKSRFDKLFGVVKLSPFHPLVHTLIHHGYDDLPPELGGRDLSPEPITDMQTAIFNRGGFCLGKDRSDKTKHYIVESDTHVLCLGATRSGKSRTVNLPTVVLQALAGENMVSLDVKGEMYFYTAPFLERLGYNVVTLDFNDLAKSAQYNFLQPVIDAVSDGDIAKAIERARDIVTTLVSEENTNEKLWVNGERAVMTCGIMAVVYDNRDEPHYQNLGNVYYFLAKMCKEENGVLPLSLYLNTLPSHHPAIHSIDISEIAPSKMRGSFYTSALTTLEMFVANPYVYSMTQKTSFDMAKSASSKTAVFLIVPDEKSTYYSLASLFIHQHYQCIVQVSKKHGNRLPIRTNYNLDEFGNASKLPDFAKQVTVGGGRGIRYNIFLQDFNQLDKIYGDKDGKTIRNNMETWVYLQSGSAESRKEFSDNLGKYTIKSPSVSSSSSGSGSQSYNYTGRELLTPEEIQKIQRPYQLVISRNSPAIMYAPDISETIMNKMLGLGNEEHNKKLIMHRDRCRPQRMVQMSDVHLKPIEKYIPYGQLPTAPLSEPTLLSNVKGE